MNNWNNVQADCSSQKKEALIYKYQQKRRDTRTRKFKNERKRHNGIKNANQRRIPQYFKFLNKIQTIVKNNKDLEETIHNLLDISSLVTITNPQLASTSFQTRPTISSTGFKTDNVLNKLFDTAKRSSYIQSKCGRR